MSFNDIEIARLRIEEARQYGEREATIRRMMAEHEGAQKVSVVKLVIRKLIEIRAQRIADSRQSTANGERPAAHSHQSRASSRSWTADI
jgi:hypothetical protein